MTADNVRMQDRSVFNKVGASLTALDKVRTCEKFAFFNSFFRNVFSFYGNRSGFPVGNFAYAIDRFSY